MTPKRIDLQLGAGACILAALLIFVGIPTWVSSPSNVRNIVLSPTFWPYVLSGLAALAGIALLFNGWRADGAPTEDDDPPGDAAAWLRLAAMAAIMVVTMAALPWLGMVWTSMIAFAMTACLYRTRHPLVAVICAVLIPLALYAFFAHVAGVAVPQGQFVRLP